MNLIISPDTIAASLITDLARTPQPELRDSLALFDNDLSQFTDALLSDMRDTEFLYDIFDLDSDPDNQTAILDALNSDHTKSLILTYLRIA